MDISVNQNKNRNREQYSFANINLLGRCNVDCFFCLGKDIFQEIRKFHHTIVHWCKWRNFEDFLSVCSEHSIEKLYITGQNTDALLYTYLSEIIDFLHKKNFKVGLRTNGYKFMGCDSINNKMIDIANKCELSTGISIHALNWKVNQMIMGRAEAPAWNSILPLIKNLRVSIVLNRCNEGEFFELLRYLSNFDNIKYIQVRKVSTDKRFEFLQPDMVAYERQYTKVKEIFQINRRLWYDAEEYIIYGKPVVFWRTVKTSVNSINYFTDGTISKEYFIVEGYLKNRTVEEK